MVSSKTTLTENKEADGMDKIVTLVGNIIALAGVLLTATAGVARVLGHYYFGGFEVLTLFVGGMGLMLIGCLAKLHHLSGQRG